MEMNEKRAIKFDNSNDGDGDGDDDEMVLLHRNIGRNYCGK